jgi:hypothetical protein
MGCSSSKNLPREEVVDVQKHEPVGERIYKENARVENDATYTGEFMNGLKDGKGHQKCTCCLYYKYSIPLI